MDVVVDPDRCQGHTICAMQAPDVFELSEIDGHASVAIPHPEGKDLERARDAERSCPERAISIR